MLVEKTPAVPAHLVAKVRVYKKFDDRVGERVCVLGGDEEARLTIDQLGGESPDIRCHDRTFVRIGHRDHTALGRFDVRKHDNARSPEQFRAFLVRDVIVVDFEPGRVTHHRPISREVVSASGDHESRFRKLSQYLKEQPR